jgi:pectate lyase
MEGAAVLHPWFGHVFFADTACRTTGGSGGTVTTVSTLAQFTAAVNEKDSAARIVVVKGIISGATQVRIGSNKSVIGLQGAGQRSSIHCLAG